MNTLHRQLAAHKSPLVISPLLLVPRITWIAHIETYSLWKRGIALSRAWSFCMHEIQWEIHHWLCKMEPLFQVSPNRFFHVAMPYPDAPVQLHVGTDRLSETDSCYIAATSIQESEEFIQDYVSSINRTAKKYTDKNCHSYSWAAGYGVLVCNCGKPVEN